MLSVHWIQCVNIQTIKVRLLIQDEKPLVHSVPHTNVQAGYTVHRLFISGGSSVVLNPFNRIFSWHLEDSIHYKFVTFHLTQSSRYSASKTTTSFQLYPPKLKQSKVKFLGEKCLEGRHITA